LRRAANASQLVAVSRREANGTSQLMILRCIKVRQPRDHECPMIAPGSYRLIIRSFRMINQPTAHFAGDDPMRPNPSEGGYACARNKNKDFGETSPEDEKCRSHDDNSSAPRPASAL
jgi:hypothetical protein